jgi:hypothetical protein
MSITYTINITRIVPGIMCKLVIHQAFQANNFYSFALVGNLNLSKSVTMQAGKLGGNAGAAYR